MFYQRSDGNLFLWYWFSFNSFLLRIFDRVLSKLLCFLRFCAPLDFLRW